MLPGMQSPADPARCPLCGEPNACALARPGAAPDDPCWCRDERFPPELLARVPAPARRRACLCRACARRAAEAPGPV
jgi:hypothetical protein